MNNQTKVVPISVSMTRAELKCLDAAAKQHDVTRSEFVRNTAVATARELLDLSGDSSS